MMLCTTPLLFLILSVYTLHQLCIGSASSPLYISLHTVVSSCVQSVLGYLVSNITALWSGQHRHCRSRRKALSHHLANAWAIVQRPGTSDSSRTTCKARSCRRRLSISEMQIKQLPITTTHMHIQTKIWHNPSLIVLSPCRSERRRLVNSRPAAICQSFLLAAKAPKLSSLGIHAGIPSSLHARMFQELHLSHQSIVRMKDLACS